MVRDEYIASLEKRLYEREQEIEDLKDRILNQDELIRQQEDDYKGVLRENYKLSDELKFASSELITAEKLADYYATPENEREEP